MKKQILDKLAKIQKVAEATGMKGEIRIEFDGCTIQEWDEAIESITEYPRHRHNVTVSTGLNVALLLG